MREEVNQAIDNCKCTIMMIITGVLLRTCYNFMCLPMNKDVNTLHINVQWLFTILIILAPVGLVARFVVNIKATYTYVFYGILLFVGAGFTFVTCFM